MARFGSRRRCPYCAHKNSSPDYKAPAEIGRYITEGGKIEPRRKSGLCAKHQRDLKIEIKRARQLAYLPYASE